MTERTLTKTCSKCKIEKPLSEFYKDKNASDGLRNPCKTCDKKTSSEYRSLSSKEKDERVSERQRIKKRKKTRLAYFRKRYQANKEKLKTQSRAWKAANPDKVFAYSNANRNLIQE